MQKFKNNDAVLPGQKTDGNSAEITDNKIHNIS